MSPSRWPVRIGLSLLTTTIGVGGLAAPAHAATGGVVTVVNTTQVRYKAAAGKTNSVVVTRSGRTVTIDDIVAIKAGKGCTAVKGDKTEVRCTPAKNPTRVDAFLGDKNDVLVNKTNLPMSVDGGSGGDRITGGPSGDDLFGGSGGDIISGLGGSDYISGDDGNDSVSGGDGDDHIDGDAGNDRLFGSNGNDYISDSVGNDLVNGGPGDDVLFELTDQGRGADTFVGGSGDDTVTYVGRTKAITADADGVKGDDGEAGEHDTIGADVEILQGGAGNDRLIGTSRAERLLGDGGNDVITGGGGDDVLMGDAGRDRLDGGAGNDDLIGDDPDAATPTADMLIGGPGEDSADYMTYTKPIIVDLDGASGDDGQVGEHDTIAADVEDVFGGYGNDRITGNAGANKLDGGLSGNDVVYGGAGNDTLDGGDGRDSVYGQDGDDTLWASDGVADPVVDGGANGSLGDNCLTDAVDPVQNCERSQP